MALSSFTVTIITKSDSPFNIIPNAPIEIRERLANGSSGGLSLIFSDSAGTVPITQAGATANSLGQFTFFAQAADYNAVYDNNGTPVTIAIDVGVSNEILNERFDRLNPATLEDWQADTSAQLDDVVTTAERTAGGGGGADGDVIASGTETGFKIVKHNTLPLSIDFRVELKVNPAVSGVIYDADNRDASDGKYYVDVGLGTLSTNNQLSQQAVWDYAYFNGGVVQENSGSVLVDNIVWPPVADTNDTRGNIFKAIGVGAGNIFVATPTEVSRYVSNGNSPTFSIENLDALALINGTPVIDISGFRYDGESDTTAVVNFEYLGTSSNFSKFGIQQWGDGDGLNIDYLLLANIFDAMILNGDAFLAADGLSTRTGVGIIVRAVGAGAIPLIRNITVRGFDIAYVMGDGATSSDNMSGLRLEQLESSFVRVGLEIRQFTLMPTLAGGYFEGIEEIHIDDDGTGSDIHGCHHFFNPESLGGVTYYKSIGISKGNNYHHNNLETNRPNDTLIDVRFDEPKSVKHNLLTLASINRTGVTAIKVRGTFPKIDISNTYSPRGEWLGGAAGKHNGAVSTTVLTDPLANYVVNGLVGLRLLNVTQGVASTVLSNTATTITTAVLGADKSWAVGDAYTLAVSSLNGDHVGVPSANVLNDTAASFVVNGLVGMTLTNLKNNATTIVTSNTATTITGLLSGGAVWAVGNVYSLGYANSRGAHDGAGGASVLVDSLATFGPDSIIDFIITNETDGSTGTITANTRTTITATLAGGTDDDWDVDDIYTINDPTIKIRYMNIGSAIIGRTEAPNGNDFTCPLDIGAQAFVKGQTVLTEAHVAGNTLTIPDGVNVFDFTPGIAVNISTIVGNHEHGASHPVRFNCTNTNVTFTDSSLIQMDGGVAYTGKGSIEFMITKIGINYFSDMNYKNTYL